MSGLNIDQCKVFENFMKNFNIGVIAAAYEKSCFKRSYTKRMRSSIFKSPGFYYPNMMKANKIKNKKRVK